MDDTNRSLSINRIILRASAAVLLLQLVWGFTIRFPAGPVTAVLASLELLPYVLAWRLAKSERGHTGRSAIVGIGIFVAMFLYLAAVGLGQEYIHEEYVSASRGGRNCGLPTAFIVGFWLLVLPVVQLVILGFVWLLACLLPR